MRGLELLKPTAGRCKDTAALHVGFMLPGCCAYIEVHGHFGLSVTPLINPTALPPADVLMPEELTWLMAAPHKQLALSQALSSIVAAADIDPMTRLSLNEMLSRHTFTFGVWSVTEFFGCSSFLACCWVIHRSNA